MRIKAVAGVSAFNIGSARRDGVGPLGAQSAEYRTSLLERSAQARTREAAGGEVEMFSLINDPSTSRRSPTSSPSSSARTSEPAGADERVRQGWRARCGGRGVQLRAGRTRQAFVRRSRCGAYRC
jgi:hypothetical protein